MWLTRLALRNPILILMMSLMVIALGALAAGRLSVDLFPNIDIPVIRVVTFYSGAGPEDIEKSITQPVIRSRRTPPRHQVDAADRPPPRSSRLGLDRAPVLVFWDELRRCS